jgi:hypothetical protein
MWNVVAAAVVSSYGAAHAQRKAQDASLAEQRRQFDYARGELAPYGETLIRRSPKADLAEAVRQHKARIDAEQGKVLRDAQVGAVLLLALIVTAAVGAAQLFGVI